VSRRVVFIGPCYPFKGGISKYAARLAWRLSQRVPLEMHTYVRLYPRWLFPGRSEPEPVRAHNDVPFAVRDLSFLRPWTFFRLGCRLRREAEGVDGVILTWWTAAWALHSLLFCAGLRGRLPLVLWCHNVFDHGRGGLLALPVKSLLKAADGFVVHSGSERMRLEAISGWRPVGMAPLPPLHAGEFEETPPAVDRVPAPVFQLLFFGFVRPYKGLEDLLEALVTVCETVPVELTIRGECWGNMRQMLAGRVRELGLEGKVHVHDTYTPDDHLAAVFAACDAVVLPYREATGSGVVSLAHQFARPAIVTAVGSLPEAVVPGCSGWVCRAGDPAALAATILEAVREPISPAAVRAARPDATAAWDALTGCLADSLKQCAQRGGRPVSGPCSNSHYGLGQPEG